MCNLLCTGLHVYAAEVYTEGLPAGEGVPYTEACAQEIHNFLIQKESGGRIATREEQQYALICTSNMFGIHCAPRQSCCRS